MSMPYYYVNKEARRDGKHEVHASRCIFLPIAKTSSVALGTLNCAADAIDAAKAHYKYVIACGFCLQDSHLKNVISEKNYIQQKNS